MICKHTAAALMALAALAVSTPARGPAPGATYREVKTVAVPGDGFWDYLTVDEAAHRLYVAHGTSVVAIDTQTLAVVGEIKDTPGVHGMAVVPKSGRGYTSNGREDAVSVVDLKTLATLSKIHVGKNPDAIMFAAASGRVYAFNAGDKSASAIDPGTGKVIATVPLGGDPEFAVEDAKAGVIFDNIEDTSEIVAIDEKTNAVRSRWKLEPGEEPTGLAIDVEHHRLFSGCHNGVLVVLDSQSGRRVTTVPIGRGVDGVKFDPGTGLAFASCGDGTMTIIHEDSPDSFRVAQTLKTAPGARTMAVDTKTHRVFVATADFEPAPEPAPGQPRRRPAVKPGTFRVIAYGPE